MTNFAEVWSRKSDEQVQDAARHIVEYAEEAQAAILSEVSQRGLTVDQTITVTPSSLTFVDCYLRGWKRSFAFRGRAGRKECFTFIVVNHAILVGGLSRARRNGIERRNGSAGQCGQFSISISNGQLGMTVRVESEAEFREFLEHGAVEKS